jgi:hypothetical protein
MAAQAQTTQRVSLHGVQMGYADDRGLLSNGYRVTSPAVIADVTISAEGATVANRRDITIAVKDSTGAAVTAPVTVEIWVMADAAGLDITTTGGSTGIAENSVGQIIDTVLAKKHFICRTTAAGLLNLIYTDTGTDTAFLGVELPNGNMIMCGELTNAT